MTIPERTDYLRRDAGMPGALKATFWFLIGTLYGWLMWGWKP